MRWGQRMVAGCNQWAARIYGIPLLFYGPAPMPDAGPVSIVMIVALYPLPCSLTRMYTVSIIYYNGNGNAVSALTVANIMSNIVTLAGMASHRS